MNHIKYSGLIQLSHDHTDSVVSNLNQDKRSFNSPENKFYISNRQLVKFKSKDYILLLDGIIYEFDNQPFSEDQYSHIVDHLSKDSERTMPLINGEFVLFLIDRCTSTIMIATSESGNSALFYRKLKDSIEISNSLQEITKSAYGSLEIRYQRIYDIFTGNNLGSENTCFSDILRLLPGHYMVIKDGVVTITEYSKLYLQFKPDLNQVMMPIRISERFFNSRLKIG